MINPKGHKRPIDSPPDSGGLFTIKRKKLENNRILCEFTLSNFTTTNPQAISAIPPLTQETPYHPLIATGSLDGTTPGDRNEQGQVFEMEKHKNAEAQSRLVQLNHFEQIIYNLNVIDGDMSRFDTIETNCCIMVFTWIVIVSTIILIVRYLKNAFIYSKLPNEAV
ncbi:unnamed protein product [Didymodactylos carnosus]|uniref:Uncharacterized protein n=1 Tax=Didymodactylos carnosus TaxID=1234261 RepID=A0A815F9R7_9BILA|nr:unnamed protein product [Didymodactylos carnosus]CAF1316350.1 unnamed protein product [Didymodactylos carnosus]CAF3886297.1 unnamed protein product [Didymodactylos carnosus]CAF4158418.1 unnamed protein product [Didymodactylos carnosus]